MSLNTPFIIIFNTLRSNFPIVVTQFKSLVFMFSAGSLAPEVPVSPYLMFDRRTLAVGAENRLAA